LHKRKHTLLFLTVLFFLLWMPLLFPVLGSQDAQGYDYVDSNTSNVDTSSDRGTHSNFTTQKYYDAIYDTLTEADTGGQSSDNNVDSEIVTHGSTTGISGAQTVDGTTENMTEGTIEKIGTDTSATGTALTLSFSHTLVAGSDRLVVVSVGIENGNTIDVDSVTYGGQTCTKAIDHITGASGFRFLAEIWYILDADLPSDDSQTVAITCSGTVSQLEVNGFCSEYTGVTQGAPEATDGDSQTAGSTITNTISPSDNAWVISGGGSGNVGNWAHDQGQVEVLEFDDSSSTFFVTELRGASEETSLSSTYTGNINRLCRACASWTEAANYQLDIEHVVNSIGEYENYNLTVKAYRSAENFYLQLYNFSSSQWVNMSTITASSLTWYNSTFTKADFVNNTNQGRIRYWQGIDATQETLYMDYSGIYGWNTSNYELDLEIQWTDVEYTRQDEELCIKTGTTDAEDIIVYVWNITDSSWIQVFSDLTADAWNNVSITNYLDNETFTVRFLGGTESGDTFQDSWEIDATLLHTWGASPIANFSYTPENPYTGEIVTFNASGSYDPDGSIVSYFWDFGVETNATGMIATHAYVDDGTYAVVLTVTDNHGLSDTTSANVTVLNRPPVAIFSESAETVYTSEYITFNATDSYDPDGVIVSYVWDFGDGTNATGMVVEHAYGDDGIYTVTLTVTDDDSATATATATKTILNRPPVAVFTESTETVYTGETITFNASDSYDPDGTITSYFWDFGDGTNATGVVVSHVYADDGTYIVTLTVTDDDGATDTVTATKTALNRAPIASFTESAEIVNTVDIIYFNAYNSYDPDGTIVSYFWDFGDGTNTTGVTVEHAYANDGSYTVTLNITDDDGATATATSTKTVLNRSPVASFTESDETAYTGEAIVFNASASYDPDGSIVSYFWDFGDGTNGTGMTVNHSYADDGTYIVTLKITDNDGATDTANATKTVLNRPPGAIFTESAETVYTGEAITFNASDSYDPDGAIVTYFWDFGDSTNAIGVTVEHTYATNGTFIVTLTVTDDDGASDSASSTKTILVNETPVALLTESAETVYTAEVIYFNASSSYDPDGTIVSYFWDFGDGTNATGVIVSHAYADDGTYTVTLTITDNDGAASAATATKTVLNRPPVASFTESAETLYTGEAITFNASESYDSDGTIVTYYWDFGDGANATGAIVDHAYSDNGTYTATLTVTDDDGATAIATSTKTVFNRPPVSSFTESAETVYTGETISFNASGSYDTDGIIISYFWDFGDGTNATGVTVDHAYADDGNYTVTLTVTDDDGATSSISSAKIVLNASPVAIFTESAETVYTSETITFNASQSYDPDGTIVSYFWDFGDGANATGAVVEHSYVDDGTYTVTLTVTDNDGASSSTSATKTISNKPPVAVFTESAETVYTGEIISFDASDSYDLDGTIVNYFWDFGDGTNATGVTIGHSYADNGTYTVTLTVTDNDDATATTTSVKTILNRPPVATFTQSATVVYTGEIIHFDASESSDPDGVIVSYFWGFGDGLNATGVTVEHAYADDGSYTVTLVVTDDDGASATATGTTKVLNRFPVAIFTESAETVYTNEVITFNASDSYDPDGVIVSYFWDFGDGTNATGIVVEHAYADHDIYTVTLTMTDDDGASASTSATKKVLNRPPMASFTESTESVVVGEVIYFNASASYDPDGIIVNYFWDFGDGTNATGVTTEHAYAGIGVFTVTLTITDDDGATASTTATKTVGITPPVTVFTESAESVLTGEIIYFNASQSYDPDGTIVSYFWDFGDSTNATGVTAEHAYADNGNYTVTLTVTDDDGATDTTTSTKTVLNRPPVPSFTESVETVYTGEVIYFNATESYDADGSIVSYFWDFGDGINATGIVVEHAYSINGTYTVTLTVSDDDDASDSTSATKTILWNEKPVASFTESAETIYTSEAIYFNASNSYDSDGYITSYFWDFGDGTNATGIVVEHGYADNGNYTVTLTVTDDKGATSTVSASKTILNRSPVALFTESTEIVYTGEAIAFNASDSYDPDGTIANYFWDFGDGTNATGVAPSHSYADNGTYTVTLIVIDDDDAYNSTSAIKTVLNSSPVAAFTESGETVYTSQSITFNASDSYDPDGVIVSYFWDFGDGTNSTGIVVEHAYSINGTYTVTLTVSDDDDASDSTSATKTILWNEPPVALFTESAETIYQGETITFNASSSYDLDGAIAGYFWDFGDGTNATDVAVEHTYLYDGNYTVTLNVTDDRGATDAVSATKMVLNRGPVVLFTESSTTVYTGEVITFNASESYDPDGFILSYLWDFGDGANATDIVVTHVYDDDGQYTVTLTLVDNNGGTASASAIKTILNRLPVAIFTTSSTTVYTGEVITFNASESYDPDGEIISNFWDFGDGNTAYGVIVNHAYSYDGRYLVTLTVTDDDVAQNTTTVRLMVLNRSPVANFVESTETSWVGVLIAFDASNSYDADGYIANYLWDFGDGTNATGVTVSHTYSINGTFAVVLTVADDDGAFGSVQAAKTILENELPIASFTESAETVYTSETIIFNASNSYDSDGYIASYLWDFGDGANATGMVVGHGFVDNGNYTVTLSVTDDKGATNSATVVKTVLNRLPVPSFTESVETAYVGEIIDFNASASYDSDGYITGYFWDFGDGTNATGMVVEHAYLVNETFAVVLTVADDDGAFGSVQAAKTILGGIPDVAIVNVTSSAAEVYKHQVLNVSVIVANEGTEVETFNVTLYASEVHGWHLIEMDGNLVWYSNGENSGDFLLVTSTSIPADSPMLTFETKYNIEHLYDFGFVQISTDEGATWVSLENLYTTYEHQPDMDSSIIANLPGFTGTAEGWPEWMTMTFNLSDYAGETVLLGFRYMTDLGHLEEGWYINNVAINGFIISNQAFEQLNPPTLNVIQTLTVINLAPTEQTTLIFSWNTTSTLSGKYSISAIASTVKGETDTLDNVYVDGIVKVKMNPDIDGDGDVDIFDVVAVTGIYGCLEGAPCWNPRADLVEDGVINIYDVVIVSSHYGETIEL